MAILFALGMIYLPPVHTAGAPASPYGYLQSEENPEKRVTYSGAAQSEQSRENKQDVYRALQETCQRWTDWYNKDRSAQAAVQMNEACRQAADYGSRELKLNTRANQVNLRSIPERKASSGGDAVLISNNSGRTESPRCQHLRRELENIQSRLRAGYKVREGERLKKRRREIRNEIQQRC